MVAGRGQIRCLPDGRGLVLSSAILGVVQAYRPDGSVAWTARLARFEASEVRALSPTSGRVVYPASGLRDRIASLISVGTGQLLVQVVRESALDNSTINVRSTIIDEADGRVLGYQEDLPLLLAAGNGLVARPGAGSLDLVGYSLQGAAP